MNNYCVIFSIGNGGVRVVPVKARTKKQAAKRARTEDTECENCFVIEIHKQEVRAK